MLRKQRTTVRRKYNKYRYDTRLFAIILHFYIINMFFIEGGLLLYTNARITNGRNDAIKIAFWSVIVTLLIVQTNHYISAWPRCSVPAPKVSGISQVVLPSHGLSRKNYRKLGPSRISSFSETRMTRRLFMGHWTKRDTSLCLLHEEGGAAGVSVLRDALRPWGLGRLNIYIYSHMLRVYTRMSN